MNRFSIIVKNTTRFICRERTAKWNEELCIFQLFRFVGSQCRPMMIMMMMAEMMTNEHKKKCFIRIWMSAYFVHWNFMEKIFIMRIYSNGERIDVLLISKLFHFCHNFFFDVFQIHWTDWNIIYIMVDFECVFKCVEVSAILCCCSKMMIWPKFV